MKCVIFQLLNQMILKKQDAWVKVMNEEMKMIDNNKTRELVDQPHDRDVIGVKWV